MVAPSVPGSDTHTNTHDTAAAHTHDTGASKALLPLAQLARLDTCVTVVDASNLLDNLHSLQTLRVRDLTHTYTHTHMRTCTHK